MYNSKLFFSKNILTVKKYLLATKVSILQTGDLGTYLGIMHKSVSMNTYGFLLDKIKKILSAWKGRNMLIVARALLIQTSLNSIASYATQTSKLPINMLDHLDKISRSFLWGEQGQYAKMHTISWKKICQPRENG